VTVPPPSPAQPSSPWLPVLYLGLAHPPTPHELPWRPLQRAVLAGWTAGVPLLGIGLALTSLGLVAGGGALLLTSFAAHGLVAASVLRHLPR
jgi:hypothetical protein